MRIGAKYPQTNLPVDTWEKLYESHIAGYMTLVDSPDWDLIGSNSDDWTVEAWTYIPEIAALLKTMFIHFEDATNFWSLHIENSRISFVVKVGGSNVIDMVPSPTHTLNTWHHTVLCKVGSDYGLYVDGVQVDYASYAGTITFTGSLDIGRRPNNSAFHFLGNMCEMRIQHSNIYSAAPVVGLTDTITFPTAPLVSDANTKLLIHGRAFEDSSSRPRNPITNNNVTLSTGIKQFGAGSGLFNGTTAYLTSPYSPDWEFMADNSKIITVDFFVKHNTADAFQGYFGVFLDANNRFFLYRDTPDFWGLYFITGGSTHYDANISSVPVITDTNWHHVMWTWNNGNHAVYLDGVQAFLYPESTEGIIGGVFAAGARLAATWGAYLDGYMDELRVVHGNPFSATPAGAGVFNGTNASLTAPDHADWDIVGSNSDDWTIEMRVLFKDVNQHDMLIMQAEDGNNAWYFQYVGSVGSVGMRFYVLSVGTPIVACVEGSLNFVADTWYHLAMCKVGSSYGIYKDGVQIAYDSNTSIDTFAAPLTVGAYPASPSYLRGDMDEVRIIHSNPFSAAPNVGLSDTITPQTTPYVSDADTKLLLHLDDNVIDSGNTGHVITNTNVTFGMGYFGITVPTSAHTVDDDTKLLLHFDSLPFEDFVLGHVVSSVGVGIETGLFGTGFSFGGASTNTIAFDGLNGDIDEEYMLEIYFYTTLSAQQVKLRFNGDAGANYGQQRFYAQSTTTAGAGLTGQTGINVCFASTNQSAYCRSRIFAKSGKNRMTVTHLTQADTGTTVDSVEQVSGVWNNQAANLTTITLVTTSAGGFDSGTHVTLYRKANA